MRIAAAFLAILCAPVILAGQQVHEPTFPAPAVGVSSAGLRQTFANYWQWQLAEFPELATAVGRTEHNARWRDWSKAGRARVRTAQQEFLQQVLYVGIGNLTVSEHLSADLLDYQLRTALEIGDQQELISRVSQMDGLHNDVFEVIDQMPARTVTDYENIIARLRALPVYVDQNLELIGEQLASGFSQPAVVVNLMLEQVTAQGSAPPDESPLLAAFRSFPPEIGASEQSRLKAEARAAYEQQFVPSWKKVESFLRTTYLKQARSGVGLSSLPEGAKIYASLIRGFTTTQADPRQIHELGLKEVARIEAEMTRVAREAGFSGTAIEFERRIANDPALRFQSQEEMLAYAREVLARVEPQLPRMFRRLPRTKVGVRPIPPDREASSASNYTAGTADGTRPAWFNMNTYRPGSQSKYTIDALVLHESVPGHHLQIAIARELEGLPDFRTVFFTAAFGEGWALYAESLGGELSIYRDPATRFGRLASEQFRAVRLVVDTGLHAMGWTRDQARAYMTEHVPSQSLAEVDRYIALPGQALSYKLGELKIRELRQRAETALGTRFDIRDFHDAVLRNGALPLDLLEPQIDAYIAAAKAGRSE